MSVNKRDVIVSRYSEVCIAQKVAIEASAGLTDKEEMELAARALSAIKAWAKHLEKKF